ncbi:MAG: Gfo/Idh/MocA family oxidoreductase [Lactobacillales bacterium]|jgi:virulence factor|nr:Gfo/Idh/MocA family oxidoreductase [Lactobacillales bacterium]
MKIGVIGLGDIFERQYLPSYIELQKHHDVSFVLSSRDLEKAGKFARKLAHSKACLGLDGLLAEDVDVCFVHTATSTHFEIVKALIENGIDVFVDKPLTENADEVDFLQQLAWKNGVKLFIGFNRRYAPYGAFARDAVRASEFYKNRVNTLQPFEFAIYDLFIHVIDTAVFWNKDKHFKKVRIDKIELDSERNIENIEVVLEFSGGVNAICKMNMTSGNNDEVFMIDGLVVRDMVRLRTGAHEEIELKTPGDYVDRGFLKMVFEAYSLFANEHAEYLLSDIDLLSHQICDNIIEEASL